MTQYILALSISNGIQKHRFWPMVWRGMVVWGATLEPKQYILALAILNTPIPGTQKCSFWCMVCRGMGVWGRYPRTQTIYFGIAHFKHTHPRYPKTPFLPHGVQRYGCLGRHPQYILAFSISNTPMLGIQKHFFWLMMCRGMGVWGATPKPSQSFLARPILNTPILGIQSTRARPWCAEVWVFGAPAQNPNDIHPSQVSENTFSGPGCAEAWVFGAPPQNPKNISWHCPFQTHPS